MALIHVPPGDVWVVDDPWAEACPDPAMRRMMADWYVTPGLRENETMDEKNPTLASLAADIEKAATAIQLYDHDATHLDDGYRRSTEGAFYDGCSCQACLMPRRSLAVKKYHEAGCFGLSHAQVTVLEEHMIECERATRFGDTKRRGRAVARYKNQIKIVQDALGAEAPLPGHDLIVRRAQQNACAPASQEQQSVSLITTPTEIGGWIKEGKRLINRVRLTGYDLNGHLCMKTLDKLPFVVLPTEWLKVMLAIDDENEDELPWLADAMTKALVQARVGNGMLTDAERSERIEALQRHERVKRGDDRQAALEAKHKALEEKDKTTDPNVWRIVSGIGDGVALNGIAHPSVSGDYWLEYALRFPANVGVERARDVMHSRILRSQEKHIAFDQDPSWGDRPVLEDMSWK